MNRITTAFFWACLMLAAAIGARHAGLTGDAAFILVTGLVAAAIATTSKRCGAAS